MHPYFTKLILILPHWFLRLLHHYLIHSENTQSFLRCFSCCKLANSYLLYLQPSYFLSNDETFLFLLKFCLSLNLMILHRYSMLINEYWNQFHSFSSEFWFKDFGITNTKNSNWFRDDCVSLSMRQSILNVSLASVDANYIGILLLLDYWIYSINFALKSIDCFHYIQVGM
jgi:hypothetical protein